MVIISAWTRVHAGDEHERTGIADAVLGAVYADGTIFQRLSQHFEYGTLEFGQFVKEKNAVVRKGNLAGLWILSATDKGNLRNGMMWTAERALGNE